MRRTALTWMLSTCLACASGETRGDARALIERAPCALDAATVTDFPLYATSCPVMIDGVGLSPNAFNTWARVSIVIHPVDEETWRSSIPEYVEIFTKEWLIDREIERAGFELDAESLGRWYDVLFGGRETIDEKVAIASSEYRSAQEFEAMMRSVALRRAYACHVRPCEATEDDLRAYYDEYIDRPDQEEVIPPFESVRASMTSSIESSKRYHAYEALGEDVSKDREIVWMLENVTLYETIDRSE